MTRGDITSLLVYPGELRPKTGATVVTRVAGRIEKLRRRAGAARSRRATRSPSSTVRPSRSQVVQAQAALAAAEARLASVKSGGGADAQAEADASLRAAKARLAALDAAPRLESIPTLAQAARDARQRVADLRERPLRCRVAAEARLTAARQQLDSALTSEAPTAPVPRHSRRRCRSRPPWSSRPDRPSSRPSKRSPASASRSTPTSSPPPASSLRTPKTRCCWPAGRSARTTLTRRAPTSRRPRLASAGPASRLRKRPSRPAETGVEYAGAALELARLQLREAAIVAPLTGIVVETQQQQGATVPAGTPILSIQPPDYELAVGIDERQLGQVAPGQAVSVLVDVFPGESFTGTVRAISPERRPARPDRRRQSGRPGSARQAQVRPPGPGRHRRREANRCPAPAARGDRRTGRHQRHDGGGRPRAQAAGPDRDPGRPQRRDRARSRPREPKSSWRQRVSSTGTSWAGTLMAEMYGQGEGEAGGRGMGTSQTTIALDGMGATTPLMSSSTGAMLAARELGVRILLVGPQRELESRLGKDAPRCPIEVVNATAGHRDGRAPGQRRAPEAGLVDGGRRAAGSGGPGPGVRLGRQHRRRDGGRPVRASAHPGRGSPGAGRRLPDPQAAAPWSSTSAPTPTASRSTWRSSG